MRKAVILLLSVLYITLTSGVAVNVHYCMGKIAGTTYGVEDNHECDRCGMEKADGCCETEHKLVKADDDHLGTQLLSGKIAAFTAVVAQPPLYFSPLVQRSVQITPRYHAPPGIPHTDLCVLNSVFRL